MTTSASLFSRPTGFASGSSRPTVRARAVRVFQYRRILQLLIGRDLKVRYAGSALGYFWTILDPLLMSLVYWFVFTKIFHRTAGAGFDPFLLYLVTGQLAWTWFNAGVTGVTRALRAEAQMVRSSNVPRELWILRVVLSKFVEYLFGLPVLALFAAAYVVAPSRYLYLIPVGWVLEAALIIGAGLILAPCTVLFNDLERIVPIFLRVLFYASPVLYSVSNVPARIRDVFSVNPTCGFLTIAHATFFPAAIRQTTTTRVGAQGIVTNPHVVFSKGRPVIRGDITVTGGHTVTHTVEHWSWIWHSAVTTAVILVVGVFVFTRLERQVLKEI